MYYTQVKTECFSLYSVIFGLSFPLQVDNTDAEGRLLLADALCYAHSFSPSAIVDLATLTGAIDVALGSGAAGVFSNSQSLWEQLHRVYIIYIYIYIYIHPVCMCEDIEA